MRSSVGLVGWRHVASCDVWKLFASRFDFELRQTLNNRVDTENVIGIRLSIPEWL